MQKANIEMKTAEEDEVRRALGEHARHDDMRGTSTLVNLTILRNWMQTLMERTILPARAMPKTSHAS